MKIYIELGHCIIENVVEEDWNAYNLKIKKIPTFYSKIILMQECPGKGHSPGKGNFNTFFDLRYRFPKH